MRFMSSSLLFLFYLYAISQAETTTASTRSNSTNFFQWLSKDFNVIMKTHGQITFAPYIHGKTASNRVHPKTSFQPGFRSDFFAYVDFFQWKGFISNWLIAKSTIIERPDSTFFQLKKIRYTLTPGYRYEFHSWLISGLLLHECLHTISSPEKDGSTWWNSFQFGAGSKGAYNLYVIDKYKQKNSRLLNTWDFQWNGGIFLFGERSVWIAQNHNYRYETWGLLRYHVGKFKRHGMFIDSKHHIWITDKNKVEHKHSIQGNYLLRGTYNFASLYYRYTIYDNNVHDNENGLGALGFQILF